MATLRSTTCPALAGGGSDDALVLECLQDPSAPAPVPVTEINTMKSSTTLSTLAGDQLDDFGVGSSDSTNDHISDSSITESDSPQVTNLVLQPTRYLEESASRPTWPSSSIIDHNLYPGVLPTTSIFHRVIADSRYNRRSFARRPSLHRPLINRRNFETLGGGGSDYLDIQFICLRVRTGTHQDGAFFTIGESPMFPSSYGEGEGSHLYLLNYLERSRMGGIGIRRIPANFESMIRRSAINMGGTPVIQTGNIERRIIPRLLAGSTNDSHIIQIGDVETGSVLRGRRLGVSSSEITPMNDHYRVNIVDSEPQTGNDPAPLENSGNNSHLVTQLRQLVRPNGLLVLFVTSEIFNIIFEVMYQESYLGAYLYPWAVSATTAVFAARLLAENEDGIARREQFAVYFKCFSFFVPALLGVWGIHNGNDVTALKIILKITGTFVAWWVADKFQTYRDAFRMRLPISRAN